MCAACLSAGSIRSSTLFLAEIGRSFHGTSGHWSSLARFAGANLDPIDHEIAAQRKIALQERKFDAAIDALSNIEKQMRLAVDVSGTRNDVEHPTEGIMAGVFGLS